MKRIGFYGGAFDPPHIGHVQAAESFVKELSLDKLYIIPTSRTPVKSNSVANDTQRLQMCMLAFTAPNTQILDFEIKNNGISYTADTVRFLRSIHPEDELFMLLGADKLITLGHWKEKEYIFSSVHIAVIPRAEINIDGKVNELNSLGADIKIMADSVSDVSSTEIRNGMKKELLPEDVRRYIESNGIYNT